MLWTRARTRTNPLFYAERLRRLLAHDPERVERALREEESVDLLTWNLFASLATEEDRDFLASELQVFGGGDLQPPVGISLFSGRHLEPRLEPSAAYVRHVRERVGDGAEISEFTAPIEVPVRIDARNVLVLVDTLWSASRRGSGGRDRIVELVDAGLVHAQRVAKELAVAVVYPSGTPAAAEVSHRVNELRRPERLRAELPWHREVPAVRFREVTWQQLVALWERERGNLRLPGEPVRGFLGHLEELGLR